MAMSGEAILFSAELNPGGAGLSELRPNPVPS